MFDLIVGKSLATDFMYLNDSPEDTNEHVT